MTPFWQDAHLTLYGGDCREVLASMEPESVHCVVTSPPYWGLRDYGVAGQLGLEPTPEAYVANMVAVFREVRRVLRADGTLWLNLGDSYAAQGGSSWPAPTNTGNVGAGHSERRNNKPLPGLKPKDLVGIPWRVAFALQADGWYLRSDIIWAKPNPMPESVTDRPTKAHEYLFLLSKSPRYYYDADAVREADSGPSDLRKMAEGKDRIGGLVKELDDPLFKASGLTNIGRKRSVGGKQLASAQASSAATERRMGGFNDRWDASEDNGSAPVGRNLRSVWNIATEPYPGAHFATFPRKLVEPCVKAGTSERGVCPECGAPWVRVVIAVPPDGRRAEIVGRVARDADGRPLMGDNMIAPGVRGAFNSGGETLRHETTGWRATCGCMAPPDDPRYFDGSIPDDDHPRPEPVPSVVLDPFAGSGTTLLVAQALGRRGVGIDLSPEYLEQALARNAQTPMGLVG